MMNEINHFVLKYKTGKLSRLDEGYELATIVLQMTDTILRMVDFILGEGHV